VYLTLEFEKNGTDLRDDSFMSMHKQIAEGRTVYSSAAGMATDEQMVVPRPPLPGQAINLLIE
jgi:hypothetical protein